MMRPRRRRHTDSDSPRARRTAHADHQGGGSGDRCCAPSSPGLARRDRQWIQATFDLVATRLADKEAAGERTPTSSRRTTSTTARRRPAAILIDGDQRRDDAHLDYPAPIRRAAAALARVRSGHNTAFASRELAPTSSRSNIGGQPWTEVRSSSGRTSAAGRFRLRVLLWSQLHCGQRRHRKFG
jgi:hypothetical protein